MLSEDKVIALYCIVDDMLKAMRHTEDIRVKVKDSEVIATAFVSALPFQLCFCLGPSAGRSAHHCHDSVPSIVPFGLRATPVARSYDSCGSKIP